MKTKLIILLSVIILTNCSTVNISNTIAFYKQNDSFDLPTDIKINNFWMLNRVGGLDRYILDNKKKINEFSKLYKDIKYQKGTKYVLPLYCIVFNNGLKADTLYINDAGQGYIASKKKFFVEKKIYTFVKELNPEFFDQ